MYYLILHDSGIRSICIDSDATFAVLHHKRVQYAALGVPEYWLIDPEHQTVTVLELQGDDYVEFGVFRGSELIRSIEFGTLNVTAEQIFAVSF